MAQFNGEVSNIESNVNKVDVYDPEMPEEAKKVKYPSLKLIEWLLEHLGLDYPVEMGELNGWTYVKYKSGIAKLWGRFNVTTNLEQTDNGMYSCVPEVALPFPLSASEFPVVTGSTAWRYINWVNPVIGAPENGYYNKIHVMFFQTNINGNGQNTTVSLNVIGRWK